ncbi:penicillin V acylase-like amidase (Ntn superfamily) [Clostridium saccharoperbutylacetonicum]|uniref:Linear amide C-N hydrolase, choloylglycine hydrolase family n=2 Tax=Clostridium saccharoperbutylacetonicum TaxID=36745 RepID=M1LSJ6_9CLOT|nr:linear amide C-N hydrolase [Clostridium saccharoperbutylacetonicum]AGF55960.1 linear amide C-N hydrolase, choloylglycine hydrolase family [Clostridium saccharoperbutylacetonicum N1-4(HMT)]NRT63301.1 penicillin V acylase-like amidase (Ntn superfamily) [Clostridium saccharoperbutylacetonicum]NSB26663.1 penicillin V acylase-like amidase (Ntn superfamily) [Clostridium saccharoperbutylacetonicum]NSB46013.1 penicillin V acylase-like amidase (Ntn superfamily) [Clostridium saccharoperbutylacetonicum
MCTSFAVYGQEKTIYGMNFDTDEIDLKLKINSYNYKNIFNFSALMENKYIDVAGINSDGLFICTQAVQYSPGFKSSCDENDWFAFDIFDEALKKTRKTSEFFEILNKRVISYPRNPLYPDLGLHTIIADKTGDAFILEEGIDTNIISQINNDFIIMTNFPNGDFKEANYNKVYGIGADRYICAHEYIDNNIHSFGINEAFEILRKTSQENTLCSIVFEPLKNEVYISFKTDLSKKWKISMIEKTIQSLDGLLSNNKIHFTNGEIFVNDLISLYK